MVSVALTAEEESAVAAMAAGGLTTAQLYLKAGSDPRRRFLAVQADCRRRTRSKLQGWPLTEGFIFPDTLAAEQCTSTALAPFHAALVPPGSSVIDMTLGLGVDSMHIARRASSVLAFDLKPLNVEAATHNARLAGLSNFTALAEDSVTWLREHPGSKVDVIFVDPARRDSTGARLRSLADCAPDVTAMLPLLSEHTDKLIIKASPMLDVMHTARLLQPWAVTVKLLGTPGECKELVAVVDFRAPHGQEVAVTAHTIDAGGSDMHAPLCFTTAEEARTDVPVYAMPREGELLMEPYPAVSKAGCVKLLAQRYGLTKVSAATHLYCGSAMEADLPGRMWTVEAVLPFDKKGIREAGRRWPRISVAAKGLPMESESLRIRLGVKEGPGDRKLWGVTGPDGRRHMIIGAREPRS